MPHLEVDCKHIQSVEVDAGDGTELDLVELTDGLTLAVGDDAVTVYPSLDDFWRERGSPDAPQTRTAEIARTSGEVERLH